jgi:predicted metal-dependent hydrolase
MKIQIVRSIHRKTISLQILSDLTIIVTVPSFFPESKITKIIKEKEEWIKQKQLEIQMRKPQKDVHNGEAFLYLGKIYPLAIRQNQKNIVELSDRLYIGSANKTYIKQYVTTWYRQQAKKIITERVYHYSRLANLDFQSIKMTSATTRWGSCSSEKNLNFNWKLIMAPLPVIDYVVVHELAHLKELNHSKAFWETVRKMFPLYRQYRTWLKRNGHTLEV